MTRAYIRLDPAFDEHKEGYPDGPYAAYIGTLCLAESQPERGRFRSADYLKRLLGKRGRHVAYLLDHGDVVELPDGRLYVDGWDEWQEGDWKVAERVSRIRNRPRNARGNAARNGSGNGGVTARRLDSGALLSGALQSGGATPDRSSGEKNGSKEPDDEKEERVARAMSVLNNPDSSPSMREVASNELARLGVQ